MKKQFTIRKRMEDESQIDYKNYITQLIQENILYSKEYQGKHPENYQDDIKTLATLFHNSILSQDFVREIRGRMKDESSVDYMDYLMNAVKSLVPFEGNDYSSYMETVYQVASDLYERMEKNSDHSHETKCSKKKKVSKKKKRSTRRKRSLFSRIWGGLKSIFHVGTISDDLKPVEEKRSTKKKKQRAQTTRSLENNFDMEIRDASEENDELLEIDQRLVDHTDSSLDEYDVIPDLEEVAFEEEPSIEEESISIPEFRVDETSNGSVVGRVKKESSIYDEKKEYNAAVEKYVEDRMVKKPGLDISKMTIADVFDYVIFPEYKAPDYNEIQEYDQLWQWELALKEEPAHVGKKIEDEGPAKVLKK